MCADSDWGLLSHFRENIWDYGKRRFLLFKIQTVRYFGPISWLLEVRKIGRRLYMPLDSILITGTEMKLFRMHGAYGQSPPVVGGLIPKTLVQQLKPPLRVE